MPGMSPEGWWWLAGSLGAAVLGSHLAWLARRLRPGPVQETVARLLEHPLTPYGRQVVRLVYYVGVPFAALLWGQDAVVERWLGLQAFPFGKGPAATALWLDWAADVGWGCLLGCAAGVVLLLWWWTERRISSRGTARMSVNTTWREAFYHEVHWAFYRNGPVLTWGPYGGTWVGLLLVAVEAGLNPDWRAGLRDTGRAPAQLLRAAMAVLSTLVFLQTQNLWLAVPLHWAVTRTVAAVDGYE